MIVAIKTSPFSIWLAVQRDATLQHRPVVTPTGGRVQHVNAAARKAGIRPGMQLETARLRSDQLHVTDYEEPDLTSAWDHHLRFLSGFTPFLKTYDRGLAICKLSRVEAAQLADLLQAQVGVAHDAETALLAAVSTPPGTVRALPTPPDRAAFLQRLPLRFLEHLGYHPSNLERLAWLGLNHVADVLTWKPNQVRAYLGTEGHDLLQLLAGPFTTDVPLAPEPSGFHHEYAFEEPAFEPRDLDPVLAKLTTSISSDLSNTDTTARRFTLQAFVGDLSFVATRLAKRPTRDPKEILTLANLALADSGAAPVGIDRVRLEAEDPNRFSEQASLWKQRHQRKLALNAVLDRYAHAMVYLEEGDPHSQAPDKVWRWVPYATTQQPTGREERPQSAPHHATNARHNQERQAVPH